MENRWDPTQEQRDKFIPILREFINEAQQSNKKPDSIDLYGQGISPYQLQSILIEDFGFEEYGMDTNGWEMDYWIYLVKDKIKYVIEGTGMTHEIKFYVYEIGE